MNVIKTQNSNGIPSRWEISEFQHKKGDINEIKRLYVAFKVGKKKKIKRLHIKMRVSPCDSCGNHVYISGKVAGQEFHKEV